MDREKEKVVATYEETKDPRIKKLGDVYHARFSCKGQRVQQTLHTKSFKVAEQLANDIESAILLGEDWRKEKGLFDDLWDRFLEDKAKGKIRGVKKAGAKTMAQYIHFGERYYKPFFGSMRVDKMGERYDEYMVFAREKSKSGDKTKMLNHWKYLSGFFSWARAIGEIKRMPDIYNPDTPDDDDDGPGRNLSDEQLRLLRENAEMPMKLWIVVAQYMGMRSFEISQLLKSKIDLEKNIINLGRAAKGGRPRKVPIHPDVRDLLIEQMNAHKESPYLFPNAIDDQRPMDIGGFKKPWGALRERLGIECVFKDFRSSYATRAFANPKLNPVSVCMALGMSMKVAMKHYIKPDDSQLSAITEAFKL